MTDKVPMIFHIIPLLGDVEQSRKRGFINPGYIIRQLIFLCENILTQKRQLFFVWEHSHTKEFSCLILCENILTQKNELPNYVHRQASCKIASRMTDKVPMIFHIIPLLGDVEQSRKRGFINPGWGGAILPRIARTGKIKFLLFFNDFGRILVRDAVHWIRIAETPNLQVFLRP